MIKTERLTGIVDQFNLITSALKFCLAIPISMSKVEMCLLPTGAVNFIEVYYRTFG